MVALGSLQMANGEYKYYCCVAWPDQAPLPNEVLNTLHQLLEQGPILKRALEKRVVMKILL